MLLLVAAALLGASFGLNTQSRLLAPLATIAVVGAAYFVFDYLADFAMAHSADRRQAWVLFNALGVASDGLIRAAAAGAASAVLTGLLVTFTTPKAERPGIYLPGDPEAAPKKRRWFSFRREPVPVRSTEALDRIEQVLDS